VSEFDVVLEGISKVFRGGGARPAHAAVADLSLEVAHGEFVAIVGPSGCGKSTTLRLVAGLDAPDAGEIALGGRSMRGVPPQDRDVAMVFQGYALYPQMTARKILEFPLKMRKVPAAARARAVSEAAAMLGLEKLLDRRPDQLSGGERQRVAMGRAIVRRPRVFLFDEPLSNIDPALREEIRTEIGTLVRKLHATALYVTHDHTEAMTLADRIAVMRDGRLVQFATPRDIYERPATEFVGTFVGSPRMNLLPGRSDGDAIVAGPFRLRTPHDSLPTAVTVGIRPEDVVLGSEGVAGTVANIEPLGAETHVFVQVAVGVQLRARCAGFGTFARGAAVRVAIDPARVHVFDPARDGARIGP
jgi:multiple sugar transport system ATP-binding protein